MRSGKIKWAAIGLALVSLAIYFFTAETFKNPITGEEARVGLSRDQEEALGLQGFQEVIAGAETIETGPEYERVRRVATRLIEAVGEDGEGFEWQVALVDNAEANAFCLPGGKIVVYTGILSIAADDAGLATVMGHEIAHAIGRHGAQRVFQQGALEIAQRGLQEGVSELPADQQQQIMGLLGAGAQYGIVLPFSREHELEADHMGLVYMARAGYDPRQAASFWRRMSQNAGARPPELMSTHPADETRIREIEELLPRALEEYQPRNAADEAPNEETVREEQGGIGK